jgi:hypothetical protein
LRHRTSSNERTRSARKNKVTAFGAFDENSKSRARLMSFGFMPIVSYDRKVVKVTDWTIDRRKYLRDVGAVGKKVFRLNVGGSKDSVLEMDDLRRRTLTQDGVVNIRSGRLVAGQDIDIKKIGAAWEKEKRESEGGGEGGERGGGGGGKGPRKTK